MARRPATHSGGEQERPLDALGADEGYLELLGRRVRSHRTRRGMTRKQLAHESGVSERYLAQLESGRGNASILLLRQIARAMAIPLERLVTEGPEREVEEELLLGLINRLRGDQVATAHALLAQHLGLADAGQRRRRIALIGLRGAGKTTLGRALAERLALPFVELSKAMEAAAGMPMPEIVALGGQAMLRRLEQRTLEQVLAGHETLVLATGGGLVAEPASYDALLANCFTVWVTARPEEHMARVLAQGDRRPMADNPEAMEDLRRILAERQALYSKADRRLDTSGRNVGESLDRLLELLPAELRRAA